MMPSIEIGTYRDCFCHRIVTPSYSQLLSPRPANTYSAMGIATNYLVCTGICGRRLPGGWHLPREALPWLLYVPKHSYASLAAIVPVPGAGCPRLLFRLHYCLNHCVGECLAFGRDISD